jgi:hypothetical protein
MIRIISAPHTKYAHMLPVPSFSATIAGIMKIPAPIVMFIALAISPHIPISRFNPSLSSIYNQYLISIKIKNHNVPKISLRILS